MPDLVVTDDLKSRFSQFHDIAAVTANLRSKIDQINTLNKTAAGNNDEYAHAYHKQVDDATNNLSDLVDSVRKLFGLTADGGNTASGLFKTAGDAATKVASHL
jgi:hypothetical protein